jgi:hypothetical protein
MPPGDPTSQRLFGLHKQACKCGAVDVSGSDRAGRQPGGPLVVHGLMHCYAVAA